MIAKAPDIIAWLAIIAAATATTNVGQYNGPDNKIMSLLLNANLLTQAISYLVLLRSYLGLICRMYLQHFQGRCADMLLVPCKPVALMGAELQKSQSVVQYNFMLIF